MATEMKVGGRMETVTPKPVTDSGDRRRIWFLLALSLAIHVWTISHAEITARDGPGFARLALQYEDPVAGQPVVRDASGALVTEGGKWTQLVVMQQSHHPPGYPLAVVASHLIVSQFVSLPLPDEIILSAQITSGFAAFLMVIPTYWLGRLLYSKFAGFAAALLIQVLPQFVEVTSDALTEGLFLLLTGTALTLGVRAVKTPRISGFLLCGLATACAFLVRPEGVLSGLSVGLVGLGMIVFRYWRLRSGVAWLLALSIGALIPAVPYMVLIGGISNKPTTQGIIPGVKPARELLRQASSPSVALLADRYSAAKDGPIEGWVAQAIVKETTKSFHYVPAGLALLGLLLSVRRLRAEPWFWILIVMGLLHLAALVALGLIGTNPAAGHQNYISERHTLPLVLIGCFFAAGALEALPGLGRRLPVGSAILGRPAITWLVLIGIVISCVPKIVRPLHADRVPHKIAGEYLRDELHLQPDDTLIDPYSWAAFYSGRTVRTVPPDLPNAKVAYAVLRPRDLVEDTDSLLTQLKDARNIALDGHSEIVFEWPPNAAPDKVELRIYKLVRDDKNDKKEKGQQADPTPTKQ